MRTRSQAWRGNQPHIRATRAEPLYSLAMAHSHPYAILFCDACGKPIEGEPGGAGIFVFSRGDEVRYEEPPLCEHCGYAIGITAMVRWAEEEEEG